MAFISNLFHMIEILNDLWNSIRTFNVTALIWAVSNGQKEIVEMLLRHKDIDVNINDILNQKHL